MSLLEWRGGIPVVFQGTVDTTGIELVLGKNQLHADLEGRKGPITSKWMRIQNHDLTNTIKVYFIEKHFTDDEHFVMVGAATAASGPCIWEGPVEAQRVWLKATAGTPTFDLTAFARRG